MGQRHQYIVVYPPKFLNDGNPNNKPQRANLIHHQWLYGYQAVAALDRVLKLVKNSNDGYADDYLFGRGNGGYTSGDGTHAIAAAISVDPDIGYYHRVHIFENDKKSVENYPLDEVRPNLFDNNDGITVVQFEVGKSLPKYCFIAPELHLEGGNWSKADGRGPWSAKEYLHFYYSNKEIEKWTTEDQEKVAKTLLRISENAGLITKQEVVALLPGMKLGRKK